MDWFTKLIKIIAGLIPCTALDHKTLQACFSLICHPGQNQPLGFVSKRICQIQHFKNSIQSSSDPAHSTRTNVKGNKAGNSSVFQEIYRVILSNTPCNKLPAKKEAKETEKCRKIPVKRDQSLVWPSLCRQWQTSPHGKLVHTRAGLKTMLVLSGRGNVKATDRHSLVFVFHRIAPFPGSFRWSTVESILRKNHKPSCLVMQERPLVTHSDYGLTSHHPQDAFWFLPKATLLLFRK